MGVPKFYRFISDRYPSISKTVKEYEIPEYENLYLDMNSIIHTCSHPSDSDVHFRIGKKEFSDEDIYQNVCRYIEIIFSIVNPANLMYLAFDGVAPRAKMNQQRGHRFRYAKEEALVKNEVIQEDILFDANCITPGTVFMAELIDHVKHFVAYKISTDSAWQKCKIIVSGPEVPGEGEHKIMEYIRYNKAQPNYNQNTRHCLYSWDADLIILGLCTHEPHFSLIREKITFGKRMNMITPEESDFELLHLSLLREYLEYEFTPIKSKLKFPFDLEKIIDDWVLIGFLVGNDFIPQLPNLNIVDGALPLLYQTYMKVLPTLDGYINEFGELNVRRFKVYINMLSGTCINSSDACKIPEFLANEPESEDNNSNNDSSSSQVDVNDTGDEIQSAGDEDLENRRMLIENAFKELDLKSNTSIVEESEETEELSSIITTENINETKENVLLENPVSNPCMEEYYKNKLKFAQIDKTEILPLVQQYARAIQWTLRYYYQGCCSWSWYYPYHYAPLTSDFDMLQDVTFDFTMDTPFLPLQHLLAVLPPANVHLLPKSLHFLLTNPKSPIIDFYPKDFEVDLNGKTNDWESIVLIPFIDENRLIKAMEPFIKSLSFKEQKRNKNGPTFIFTHTKNSLGQYPVETIFGSFENHSQLEHKQLQEMHLSKDKLIQGLCPNVSLNLSFPGFPTLKHIPHTFKFSPGKSKFKTHKPTQIERMILHVSPKLEPGLEDLAKEFLGQKTYACWPYMQDVHIIGVTDFQRKIMLKNFWKGYTEDNVKNDKLLQSDITKLHEHKKAITEKYKGNFGIEIGKTNILFYLFPLLGRKYACMNNGKLQLQMKWSQTSKLFPYHLVLKEDRIHRCTFILYKSINDLFINGSSCFMISQPNYGAKGEIKGFLERQQLVSVMLESSLEPDFSSLIERFFVADTTYVSSNKVAEKVKTSSILISRITGSLIVTEDHNSSKYYDIGLCMKFPKHEKELFGYTKKDNKGWSYSEKAIQLIQNYMNEFPYVFENLNKNVKSSIFAVSDLFPDGLAQVNLLKVWLSDQKAHYTTFVECHTKTLGLNGVPVLEKHIENFLSKDYKQTLVQTQVKAQSLFIPGTLTGLVPPDFKAEHNLLDRIICVKNNFTVPLGLKGTIVGIQEKAEKSKNVYEVLFDLPFTGGLTLYESSEHKCYRLMGTDFINISFGQRDSKNLRRPVPSKVPKSTSNQSKKNPVDVNNPRKKITNNTKFNNNNDNKATKNPRNEAVSNTKVSNDNKTKKYPRDEDVSYTTDNNDNKSNNTNQIPRNNYQAGDHEFRLKKTYNTVRNSKEFKDCNSNEPNNSDTKIETRNSRPHNTRTRPKTCNGAKQNNVGDKSQTNNPQPNNTGTRPKTPFHKKNGKFRGQGNQQSRNANPKKSMASEINKTEQDRSNNDLRNSDANKKSTDSNENKKN